MLMWQYFMRCSYREAQYEIVFAFIILWLAIYCVQEGPPFTELLSLSLSLHFTLFSLRIAISRHFLSSSKNSAPKKNRFSFEVNGIYHNYTDHNFPFLRQPVGPMTSKPKKFQLQNYTFQTPLPDQSYHLPFVRSHGYKNFFECRLLI